MIRGRGMRRELETEALFIYGCYTPQNSVEGWRAKGEGTPRWGLGTRRTPALSLSHSLSPELRRETPPGHQPSWSLLAQRPRERTPRPLLFVGYYIPLKNSAPRTPPPPPPPRIPHSKCSMQFLYLLHRTPMAKLQSCSLRDTGFDASLRFFVSVYLCI